MSFSENLKLVRKDRGLSQEEFAGKICVSRQTVSKWETGETYPESEKLITISRILDISLDYLLLDVDDKANATNKEIIKLHTGEISIVCEDKNIIICRKICITPVFKPASNQPHCSLDGVDKVSFWGEHKTTLGWYKTIEDAEKELHEIYQSISNSENLYIIKYSAKLKDTVFGPFLAE